MEKKLPKNWVETEVGDISEIIRGITYNKLQAKSIKENDDYLVLRGGNIQDGKITTDTKDVVYVESNLVKKVQQITKGDVVIVGSTGSKRLIGKAGIAKEDYKEISFGAFLMLIRPSKLIKASLFDYYFISDNYRNVIRELAGGININNIRREYITSLKFPLPPLAEQQRIVAKLDELFGHLDTLKTRLTNIPQILKNFRQAVLTQAVTGKLTEEWRVGKELEEWNSLKIEEVIESLNQGWSPKCESFPSTDDEIWGVIKTSSVQPLRFIEHENKQLPIHLEPRKQHELIPGDLLITRAGPRVRVGIASLVKKVRPRLMICDKVYRLRVNKKIIKSEFLEIILNSPQILAVIEIMKTGISDSGLNLTQTKFKSIEFNLPAIEEQTEIVKRVEDLFSKVNIIEAKYQNLKTKIDSLPQAILAKAFKGELVAQLATDGDAKELLEEIQKLRESLVKEPVKKKKK